MSFRRTREGREGLTLVEVTLALALLGLVLTAALAATGSGVRAWLAGSELMLRDRREANWGDQIRSAVAAMIPMEPVSPSGRAVGQVYFLGEPGLVRFVTAHSPAYGGRGGIRLVELRVSTVGEDVALVLRDTPSPNPVGLGALLESSSRAGPAGAPVPDRKHSLGERRFRIAVQDATSCGFRYLGNVPATGPGGGWVASWGDRQAVPRAIRIDCLDSAVEREKGGKRRLTLVATVMGRTRSRASSPGGL